MPDPSRLPLPAEALSAAAAALTDGPLPEDLDDVAALAVHAAAPRLTAHSRRRALLDAAGTVRDLVRDPTDLTERIAARGGLPGAGPCLGLLIAADILDSLALHEIPAPSCVWFRWVGQTLESCDDCHRPAWEHAGMWDLIEPTWTPFGEEDGKWGGRPWKRGEVAKLRADHNAGIAIPPAEPVADVDPAA